MLSRDMLPGPPIDISAAWDHATGETGSRAEAYLRTGELVAIRVIYAPNFTLTMDRGAALAMLPRRAVTEIEARGI